MHAKIKKLGVGMSSRVATNVTTRDQGSLSRLVTEGRESCRLGFHQRVATAGLRLVTPAFCHDS